MALPEAPLTCADCGADLTPRHGLIVATMETGPAHLRRSTGEIKLCAGCADKGIRGEKLGLFEGPAERIALRQ